MATIKGYNKKHKTTTIRWWRQDREQIELVWDGNKFLIFKNGEYDKDLIAASSVGVWAVDEEYFADISFVSYLNQNSDNPVFHKEAIYRCVENTTVGESPESNPAKWLLQESFIKSDLRKSLNNNDDGIKLSNDTFYSIFTQFGSFSVLLPDPDDSNLGRVTFYFDDTASLPLTISGDGRNIDGSPSFTADSSVSGRVYEFILKTTGEWTAIQASRKDGLITRLDEGDNGLVFSDSGEFYKLGSFSSPFSLLMPTLNINNFYIDVFIEAANNDITINGSGSNIEGSSTYVFNASNVGRLYRILYNLEWKVIELG